MRKQTKRLPAMTREEEERWVDAAEAGLRRGWSRAKPDEIDASAIEAAKAAAGADGQVADLGTQRRRGGGTRRPGAGES